MQHIADSFFPFHVPIAWLPESCFYASCHWHSVFLKQYLESVSLLSEVLHELSLDWFNLNLDLHLTVGPRDVNPPLQS